MDMATRSRRECSARGLVLLVALAKKGAGNAGHAMRPQPRVQFEKSTRASHHGSHREHPAFPARMVLTVSFALFPGTGLSCPRHPWEALASQELDASVGAPEPRDFAVRAMLVRLSTWPRPPHPAPYVRDDRETPLLWERDDSALLLFLPGRQVQFGKSELVSSPSFYRPFPCLRRAPRRAFPPQARDD
jgi:hypothetical protein